MIPTPDHIKNAHDRIAPFIHRTPLLSCNYINQITESKIIFKCENFQKVGAFKIRGATNALLSFKELPQAVATHSSGNHAQALALAAKNQGIKAFIVMPNNSPLVKVNAVRDYNAEITFCDNNLQSRVNTLNEVITRTGATEIHPYDHQDIICGQATAAKEIFEDTDDLDFIVAPVGGGGLLSGTALSAKYFGQGCQVIGAEPLMADDAARSMKAGEIIPSVDPQTIADGLLTSLGEHTFPIIYKNVKEILTVSEQAIIDAMRIIWERMKIIVEPSSATALAAVFAHPEYFRHKKIAIILSGGNVDLEKLPWNE